MKLGKKLSKIKKEVQIDETNLYHQIAVEQANSRKRYLEHQLIEAAQGGFNSLKYTTTYIPKINGPMLRLIKEHFDCQHVSSKIYSYVDDWGLDNTGIQFYW